MNKKFILFDFDGVIADSYALAFEANKTICPHLSEEEYRKRFDGNINDHEAPVHTAECRLDLNFFALFIPKMKGVSLVPDMDAVIARLASNYTLIIISSTITSSIGTFLDRYSLRSYFAEILGNDVHTSKVEKIKMVFEKYQTISQDCVFITDTLGDMREASKMNVGAVGVTWGFQSRESLSQGNPFKLVDTPSALVGAVADHFAARA